MREKFIIDTYFCRADELQVSINERFKEGYYPKEIQLTPYQGRVEGFIIYELLEV